MSYNGWTNKETWLVNLWFGDCLTEMQEEGEEVTAYAAQRFVLDLIDDSSWRKSVEGGFILDMLNCALRKVNWEEIASHYKNG